MYKFMYRVIKEDGTIFTTPHYSIAKADGNKIDTTYIEPAEILTPKQWEERKKKIAKEKMKRV